MTHCEFAERREALGYSMAAASRKCHVPYRTWQNWEMGIRRLPPYAGVFLFYLEHAG